MNSLRPAPEFPSILYSEATGEITKPRHTQPEKAPTLKRRVLRGLGKAAAGTAVGFTAFIGGATGALQHDIQRGKEAVADSQPSISHVYEPTSDEYEDAATIVLTGLGTRDAAESAQNLEAHAETGHVLALEYSNHDVNIDELTDTVVEGLEAQGEASGTPIKYVSFDGLSMGGNVISAVAANIHKSVPELDVTSVLFNSSPIGEDSLSPKSSKAMALLGNAINVCRHIKICEGIEYSPTARRAIEIVIRHANYLDPSTHEFDLTKFNETVEYVDRRLAKSTTASPILVYSQAGVVQGASDELLRGAQQEFLVQHGIEQSIEMLSQDKPDQQPVSIVYTMSENPADDTVVDVTYSAQMLEAIAEEHNANLRIVPLEVGHANVKTLKKPYNKFIQEDLNPTIAQTIEATKVAENAAATFALENHGR